MLSIAVDFDGTLCEDKFPEIGEPKEAVVGLVKELQCMGVRTILWTCRRDDKNGSHLSKAIKWCQEQGLEFAAVNENLPEVQEKWGGDTRKVLADIYLDDKSLGGFSLLQLGNLVNELHKKESGV